MALAHGTVVPLGLGIASIIALLLAVGIGKETVDLLYRVLFIFRAGLRAGAFPLGALRRRAGSAAASVLLICSSWMRNISLILSISSDMVISS